MNLLSNLFPNPLSFLRHYFKVFSQLQSARRGAPPAISLQRFKKPALHFPRGWPTRARLWLEWGSSTAGQSLPAARSSFRVVYSDSISTRPFAFALIEGRPIFALNWEQLSLIFPGY